MNSSLVGSFAETKKRENFLPQICKWKSEIFDVLDPTTCILYDILLAYMPVYQDFKTPVLLIPRNSQA